MTFTNQSVEPDSLPSFENVTLIQLPKAAMWTAIISHLLFLFIVLVATAVGRLMNLPFFIHMLVFWVTGVLAFTLLSIIWSIISYQYKCFALREHDLIYQRGVIWRKVTILPFNRVQHVETTQGVLQRHFKLMTLNLFTAGGFSADLAIQGMDQVVTAGIKKMLLNRIQSEQLSND